MEWRLGALGEPVRRTAFPMCSGMPRAMNAFPGSTNGPTHLTRMNLTCAPVGQAADEGPLKVGCVSFMVYVGRPRCHKLVND